MIFEMSQVFLISDGRSRFLGEIFRNKIEPEKNVYNI